MKLFIFFKMMLFNFNFKNVQGHHQFKSMMVVMFFYAKKHKRHWERQIGKIKEKEERWDNQWIWSKSRVIVSANGFIYFNSFWLSLFFLLVYFPPVHKRRLPTFSHFSPEVHSPFSDSPLKDNHLYHTNSSKLQWRSLHYLSQYLSNSHLVYLKMKHNGQIFMSNIFIAPL